MSRYGPIEPLARDHDVADFDCGSAAQTDWLRRHALQAHQSDTTKVYVVCVRATRTVVGYYALAAGSVATQNAPARVTKGAGRYPVPVLILTRLGIDIREQGRGLGSALVRDSLLQAASVAEHVGVRALLIHAETPEAAAFYRRMDFGFEESPTDPLHLILLMKDLRRAIADAASDETDPLRRMTGMTVEEWLLASDAAIRWQAMRDLTDAPPDEVATERAKVATEGWGAQLLALQGADGYWPAATAEPEWISMLALLLLCDMGLDPSSEEARRAVGLVRENATWHSRGPWNGTPLFAGEVEPCINGRVVRAGAYFGVDVQPIVDRLLGEQMADGGWNCEQENGATVGSFHTTINVVEGLLEHERATGGTLGVSGARQRGEEYLLERRLFRRLSTGDVIDPAFTQFSFPTGYHYDVLRGLDYLRAAGVTPAARVAEAIDLVRSKRDAQGRLPLENPHESELVHARVRDLGFDMDEREGRPSRWNTLRAMRVVRWHESARH